MQNTEENINANRTPREHGNDGVWEWHMGSCMSIFSAAAELGRSSHT
jgi:hypothetical protein